MPFCGFADLVGAFVDGDHVYGGLRKTKKAS